MQILIFEAEYINIMEEIDHFWLKLNRKIKKRGERLKF